MELTDEDMGALVDLWRKMPTILGDFADQADKDKEVAKLFLQRGMERAAKICASMEWRPPHPTLTGISKSAALDCAALIREAAK